MLVNRKVCIWLLHWGLLTIGAAYFCQQDDINSYYKERYQVLTLLMSPDLLDLVSRVVK